MRDKKLDKLPIGTRIRFVTASGKVIVLTKIRHNYHVEVATPTNHGIASKNRFACYAKGIWEWNHKCVPKKMIPDNYEILQS